MQILGNRASILQKGKVHILENETCRTWYQSQGKKTKIQGGQMCAGHEQGGIDACWVIVLKPTLIKSFYDKDLKLCHIN